MEIMFTIFVPFKFIEYSIWEWTETLCASNKISFIIIDINFKHYKCNNINVYKYKLNIITSNNNKIFLHKALRMP